MLINITLRINTSYVMFTDGDDHDMIEKITKKDHENKYNVR